ncbi:hypothetical protein SAMN06309944_1019 [Micrococcales bacterium KH10]|nr:hypothetical protein SAMN06309944_1019 [Micrococcales bacterium KH10]
MRGKRRYVGVYRDKVAEVARTPLSPTATRMLFATLANANEFGHARFAGWTDIAEQVATSDDGTIASRQTIHKAKRELIQCGALEPSSSTNCLVLSQHLHPRRTGLRVPNWRAPGCKNRQHLDEYKHLQN